MATKKRSVTDLEAELLKLDEAPASEAERIQKVRKDATLTVKVDGKVSRRISKKEKKATPKRPSYFHLAEIKKAGGKKDFDKLKVNYKFACKAIRDIFEKNGLKDGYSVTATRPKKEKSKDESKDNPKTVKERFRIEVKDKDGNVLEKVQFSTEEVLGRHIMNIIYKVGNKVHKGEWK